MWNNHNGDFVSSYLNLSHVFQLELQNIACDNKCPRWLHPLTGMYIRTIIIILHQVSIENFLRMSQRKRFNRLSEIKETCTDVKLHFAIESLSPVKTAISGVKYFEGMITDGSTKLRMVGFDEQLQTTLQTFTGNNATVKADWCQIKRSRNEEEFEVLINRSTTILPSPKKINLSASSSDNPEQVGQVHKVSSIKDIFNIPDGDFSGTVTSITPVRPVTTWTLTRGNHYRYIRFNIYVRLGEQHRQTWVGTIVQFWKAGDTII